MVFDCSCIDNSIQPPTKCFSTQFFICLCILAFLQLVVASFVLFLSSPPFAPLFLSWLCLLFLLTSLTQSLLPMLPWRSSYWNALAERHSDPMDGWAGCQADSMFGVIFYYLTQGSVVHCCHCKSNRQSFGVWEVDGRNLLGGRFTLSSEAMQGKTDVMADKRFPNYWAKDIWLWVKS